MLEAVARRKLENWDGYDEEELVRPTGQPSMLPSGRRGASHK